MNQTAPGVLRFLAYALDAANAQLRHGDSVIPLRPKTLAVLHYMAERSGRLVTKAELLDAIWPDTAVTESTLTSSIKELRRLLDDDPKHPRIIETAHGHGYRFIAPVQGVTGLGVTGLRKQQDQIPKPLAPNPITPNPLSLVGRHAELSQLDTWLARAFERERQVGFIAGDAGMGKTALVDAFCAQLRAGGVLVAHGQCLEHHGASEPYLPLLEGIERLCGSAEGAPLLALLRRHAPTWLAQLVGLLEPEEIEALQRHLAGTTRERMLREMASLVVALPTPLVIILEDLHWSDNATVDLVAALAQRRDPAPLLVIGTYRPVDVVIDDHPFRQVHQQLRAHGRIRELWLNPLDEEAVGAYLNGRWPGLDGARRLTQVVHERTDGNPLFVVSVADYLAAEGVVAGTTGQCVLTTDVTAVRMGVPQGLRPMINAQIDRLADADREVLEAGSVVGRTFSAAVVATALDAGVVDVEERLGRLARRGQLVRATGEAPWPDGTVAGRYELIHSLHQQELMERVAPAKRRQLHERVATRLEKGYGGRAKEIAGELAYHFESSGHPERAVPYLEEAATRAVRRGANREGAALLERGLAVLDDLPPTPERNLLMIRAYLSYGVVLQPLRGPGAREMEQAYDRACALSEQSGELPQLYQALAALTGAYLAQARFDRAKEATARLADLAAQLVFPGFVAMADMMNGIVTFHTGDLADARACLERAQGVEVVTQAVNPLSLQVYMLNYLALALIHLGYPEQARVRNREAAVYATDLGTPFDRGQTAMMACYLELFARDMDGLLRCAEEAKQVGDDYGFPMVQSMAMFGRGRVLVARGDQSAGIALMRDGFDLYRRDHALGLPTWLANSADAQAEAGNVDEALLLVAEGRALIDATGEVRFRPELQRLEGELRERRRELDAAERCYRHAIDSARQYGARWWELRASVSLAQLEQQRRKRAAARRTLEPVVQSFTEGFDTADFRAAQQLLAALT